MSQSIRAATMHVWERYQFWIWGEQRCRSYHQQQKRSQQGFCNTDFYTRSFSLWHHTQPFCLYFHSRLSYPDLTFSILSQGDPSFWFGYANHIHVKHQISISPIKHFVLQVGSDPNQKPVKISKFLPRTAFFCNACTIVHPVTEWCISEYSDLLVTI